MARKDSPFSYGEYWLEPDEGGRGIWCRFWLDGRRLRRATMGTRDLAEAQGRLVALVNAERREAEKRGADTPLEVFLDDYERERVPMLNPRSSGSVRASLARLRLWWRGKLLADIHKKSLLDYSREITGLWNRPLTPSTVRNDRVFLGAALGWAVEANRLDRALRPSIYIGRQTGRRERWLTPQEVAALLDAASSEPHYRLLLAVALCSAARRQAVLSLRWSQFDLARGTLNLNPQGREQTRKHRPIVPIRPNLLAELRRARMANDSGDYLFPSSKGAAHLQQPDKALRRISERAGVFPAVTMHVLRHTAGTWMAQAGRPMWEIAGIMGHTEARTMELYKHHHPDYLGMTADVMDKALAPNLGADGGGAPNSGNKYRHLRTITGGRP